MPLTEEERKQRQKEAAARWYQKNKAAAYQKRREWAKANPEKMKAYARKAHEKIMTDPEKRARLYAYINEWKKQKRRKAKEAAQDLTQGQGNGTAAK